MKSEHRRDAILKAAAPLFAERGFDGTSTRDLARATGVSEALIYRHFGNKEALFEAICDAAFEAFDFDSVLEKLLRMPPSSRRLIATVHHCIAHINGARGEALPRLVLQSLLGNRTFSTRVFRRFEDAWQPSLVASIRAARTDGQLENDSNDDEICAWAVQALVFGLNWAGTKQNQDLETGLLRPAVLQQYVRFLLRGVGLRHASILRLYDHEIETIESM